MADSDRPENEGKFESNDAIKPLVDEYVASTRVPVGASDLFEERSPDVPEKTKRDLAGRAPGIAPGRPRAVLIYLIGLVAALMALMILAV